MPFSDQLIHARRVLGLSQKELARRSGVSQQAISKLESGKSSPSEYTIRLLASALHIAPSVLLDDDKTKTPTAIGDGLREAMINRLYSLSDPALLRVSDFLDGLEAGQEIRPASPPDQDPGAGSDK